MSKQIAPISRDLWMPDATSKKCFSCDRNFTAFRRKHHCRFCGLIFCSVCCNRKVVLAHARKPTRICHQCSETLAKAEVLRSATVVELDETILSHPPEIPMETPPTPDSPGRHSSFSGGDSEDSGMSIIPQIYPDTEDNTIESIMKDISTGGHSDFEQACKEFLSARAHQLLTDHCIDPKWTDLITRLTK